MSDHNHIICLKIINSYQFPTVEDLHCGVQLLGKDLDVLLRISVVSILRAMNRC